MSYSGEAAEQVVRMSLNGIEIAAKISGKAAERLAVLLYAVLKDQKRTKGKMRLANMLRSGKELKVFAVKDEDLSKFAKASKQYGVLYCMLKDRKAEDGLTDVMVRAEDASKVNRIFERFHLATIDMGSVRTEIEKSREAAAKKPEELPPPERNIKVDNKIEEFMKKVVPEPEVKQTANPTQARSQKPSPYDSSLRKTSGREPASDPGRTVKKKSVREEMAEIRKEQDMLRKSPERDARSENTHIIPEKKRYRKELRAPRETQVPHAWKWRDGHGR